MAQSEILVTQPHGGAIQRGNPGNKGGGRYPKAISVKMLERINGLYGKSYDEIIDDIAQRSEFEAMRIAAINTAHKYAELDKPAQPSVLENAAVFQHATPLMVARITQRYDEIVQGASVEELKAFILADLVECFMEGARLAGESDG